MKKIVVRTFVLTKLKHKGINKIFFRKIFSQLERT